MCSWACAMPGNPWSLDGTDQVVHDGGDDRREGVPHDDDLEAVPQRGPDHSPSGSGLFRLGPKNWREKEENGEEKGERPCYEGSLPSFRCIFSRA